MNKSELIDIVQTELGPSTTKSQVRKTLDAIVNALKGALTKGQPVNLVSFGYFSVGRRAARSGRNPRTGAVIKVEAAAVVKFKASSSLKLAVGARTARQRINPKTGAVIKIKAAKRKAKRMTVKAVRRKAVGGRSAIASDTDSTGPKKSG